MESEMSPGYLSRCHEALKRLGAPLEGWYCSGVVDYGNAVFECELCGYPAVRYVHIMVHKEYPAQVQVGCVCAGIMEGDILAAKERDRQAKNRSARKSKYLQKHWEATEDNRWMIRHKHKTITVERDSFRDREYYKIDIDGDQYHWKDNNRMSSFLVAQHYIFDIIDAEAK